MLLGLIMALISLCGTINLKSTVFTHNTSSKCPCQYRENLCILSRILFVTCVWHPEIKFCVRRNWNTEPPEKRKWVGKQTAVAGHIQRMNDDTLWEGMWKAEDGRRRRRGRQTLRRTDYVKRDLEKAGAERTAWERKTQGRETWRHVIARAEVRCNHATESVTWPPSPARERLKSIAAFLCSIYRAACSVVFFCSATRKNASVQEQRQRHRQEKTLSGWIDFCSLSSACSPYFRPYRLPLLLFLEPRGLKS